MSGKSVAASPSLAQGRSRADSFESDEEDPLDTRSVDEDDAQSESPEDLHTSSEHVSGNQGAEETAFPSKLGPSVDLVGPRKQEFLNFLNKEQLKAPKQAQSAPKTFPLEVGNLPGNLGAQAAVIKNPQGGPAKELVISEQFWKDFERDQYQLQPSGIHNAAVLQHKGPGAEEKQQVHAQVFLEQLYQVCQGDLDWLKTVTDNANQATVSAMATLLADSNLKALSPQGSEWLGMPVQTKNMVQRYEIAPSKEYASTLDVTFHSSYDVGNFMDLASGEMNENGGHLDWSITFSIPRPGHSQAPQEPSSWLSRLFNKNKGLPKPPFQETTFTDVQLKVQVAEE